MAEMRPLAGGLLPLPSCSWALQDGDDGLGRTESLLPAWGTLSLLPAGYRGHVGNEPVGTLPLSNPQVLLLTWLVEFS